MGVLNKIAATLLQGVCMGGGGFFCCNAGIGLPRERLPGDLSKSGPW